MIEKVIQGSFRKPALTALLVLAAAGVGAVWLRDLERPGVMAAHSGQSRRIEEWLRRELRGGCQAGRNGERRAIEKVAPGYAIRHVRDHPVIALAVSRSDRIGRP